MNDLDQIRDRIRTFSDQQFGAGVSLERVREVETTFGHSFPPDLVAFLTTLGCGYVSSEEFIGLGGERHLDVAIVASELRRGGGFPKHLVPIRADGFGNYDCVDLVVSGDLAAVVAWRHEAGTDEKPEQVFSGYWTWFSSILDTVDELEKEES